MIEFMVHRFIKDYERIDDAQVRARYGMLGSAVGICCNLLLFAGKLTVGLLLNSISVLADAFNNLSDVASSVIGFIGIKMASKPADRDHPFGHGRMEYVAALIVSFLVIEVGITFFKGAIEKIRNPEELSFQVISFMILLASVGVKLWLVYFDHELGKRINSKVMMAAAIDALGDVVTTLATIISICVCRFAGINIDGYVGLIVSMVVIWAGISIARDTLKPLLGEPVSPELYKSVTELVESYDGILGTHDLIVHNYGPTRSLASIHVEMSNDMDIEAAHEVIDRIEREVARALGIFLVIHVDPMETHSDQVKQLHETVETIIEGLDNRLTIHDFQVMKDEGSTKLVFDVVVPYEYNEKRQQELQLQIEERIGKFAPGYQCVLVMEKGYLGNKK